MAAIVRVPPDVFRQIASISTSSWILLRLWECGDSRLHRLIALSIETFDLCDSRLRTTPRFPSFLSQIKPLRFLSLAHAYEPLRVTFAEHSKRRDDFGPHLLTLDTSKLQTLCLSSPYIDEDFQAFTAMVRSKYEESSTSTDLPTTSPLDRMFPALTTLKLSAFSLNANLFKGLPATLTSLSMERYVIVVEHAEFFAKLPRPLLILDTHVNLMSPNHRNPTSAPRNPPPYLHTITQVSAESQYLQHLPPTLTKCKFNGSGLNSPAFIKALPPIDGITALDIFKDYFPTDRSWATHLPRSLTFLHMNGSLDFNASDILSLPRDLTNLQCELVLPPRCWDWLEPSSQIALDFWPPLLRSLVLRSVYLTNHAIKTLPLTLTSLELRVMDLINVELLPPHLQSITFHSSKVNVEGRMPPSLTYVACNISSSLIKPENLFSSLPVSMKSITLSNSTSEVERLKPDNPFILPASITSLSLSNLHIKWSALLPRTLLSLTAFIQGLKPRPTFEDVDLFVDFPPSLTVLRTGLSDATNRKAPLSEHSFSSLVHLVHFSFTRKGGFHANILKHLPSGLRKLEIEFCAGWSSTELLPYINPKWLECRLGGLTKADYRALAPHWPPEAIYDLPKHFLK